MVRPQFNLSAGHPQLLSPSASPLAGTNHGAAQVTAVSWSQGCSPPQQEKRKEELLQLITELTW